MSTVSEFIEWDVQNWSAALDFWTAHSTQQFRGCSALELGSRNGGLSLWLALQGARVVCSDVEFPGEVSAQLHKSRGVAHLLQYQAIDATQIPYASQFDVIIFKSMLGAVGRLQGKAGQARAVNEMYKALRPGGELLFAENLVGCSLHGMLRRRFVRWGNSWRYVSIDEMEEFLSPFSSVQYRTVGFTGVFGRSEPQRNLLGRLDQAAFDHIVPDNWKYIIVGVAKK